MLHGENFFLEFTLKIQSWGGGIIFDVFQRILM